MEAKDTVMNEVSVVVYDNIEKGNTIDITEELVAQAEVSFKAGKLEGYETGFSDGQVYSFTANQTVEQIKQSGRKEVADRLEKILKYNPVKSMALRSELGKYIQTLKEEKDEG